MNHTKRILSGVLSILCTASFTGSALTASAVAQPEKPLLLNELYKKTNTPHLQEQNEPLTAPQQAAKLPAAFDLRNVDGRNFVTPVKNQHPFGVCWSFGTTAAMETSALYNAWKERGIEPDELMPQIDFSERFSAWFGYTPLGADTAYYPEQAGEGVKPTEPYTPFNVGGNQDTVINMYMAGMGPVPESKAPYQNNSGLYAWVKLTPAPTEDDPDFKEQEEFAAPLDFTAPDDGCEYVCLGYYAPDEDWSLPEELRFSFGKVNDELQGTVRGVTQLPGTVGHDEENNYQFDADAAALWKQALTEGHALNASYFADVDMTDMVDNEEGRFMSSNYAHYTYLPDTGTNHAVCIVGYDDNYSRENFLQGVDEETGVDRTPPADGAWIVKNSWGTTNEERPFSTPFGVEDSGYFYLSYYDQSILPVSYIDYAVEEIPAETEYQSRGIEQYDLLQTPSYNRYIDTAPMSFANVFTAEKNEKLTAIATKTCTFNVDMVCQIYALDAASTSPTDGELLAEITREQFSPTYQRIELETPLYIAEGTTYSVVITQTQADGFYAFPVGYYLNENILDYYIAEGLTEEQARQILRATGKGVVNAGESFLFTENEWFDWSTQIDYLNDVYVYDYENLDENGYPTVAGVVENCFEYDNFPIKVYTENYDETPYTVEVEAASDVAHIGETVEFLVRVSNNSNDFALKAPEVELQIGENSAIWSSMKDIPAGMSETKELTFTPNVFYQQPGEVLDVIATVTVNGKTKTASTTITIEEALDTTEVTTTAVTTDVTTTATQAVTTASEIVSSTTAAETTSTEATTTTTYSVDELADMAVEDYAQKNDVRPAKAEAAENEDGTVTVTLYQADGTVLDEYILDPATGIGTDKAGNEVNLPQTGNNAGGTACAALSAFLLVGAGLYLVGRSGALRRKDEEV